ncbi:MAG TPA: ATP-binding protein [Planctomycetota bacterium]|nr:ATP-binding protein [Planctomycetota bacterium]
MSLWLALAIAALAGAAAALASTLSGLGYGQDELAALWVGAALGMAAAIAIAIALAARERRLRGEVERLAAGVDQQAREAAEGRRLGMLGSLAAGLAHELGQPLSAARVGIEGLHYLRQLGREPSADHVERTLARVGMSVLAMTQTIEHLKTLANPRSSPQLDELDLIACVDAVLAERDQWLRFSDTRIAWDRPATPVHARGDAAGVRLILTNLLRNAVEAVAGQGEDRRLVRVIAGPGAVVTVADSGPGIDPALIDRLFDPFVSTKGGSARGIGLSLARASAMRMGAEIEVVSALGSGSSFMLRLHPPAARA